MSIVDPAVARRSAEILAKRSLGLAFAADKQHPNADTQNDQDVTGTVNACAPNDSQQPPTKKKRRLKKRNANNIANHVANTTAHRAHREVETEWRAAKKSAATNNPAVASKSAITNKAAAPSPGGINLLSTSTLR
jgi:hypothetical protein